MKPTVNIVGGGIAGSIAAKYLDSKGIKWRLFDDGDVLAGSRASSNLYCASWLKKWSGSQASTGINVLESLYGKQASLPFPVDVRLISHSDLIVPPTHQETVERVYTDGSLDTGSAAFDGPTLVCAGRLASKLLGTNDVWCKVGHCVLFEGTWTGPGVLNFVSPFTHQKAYQYAPGMIYFADSVAVLQKQYDARKDELVARTIARARKLPQLATARVLEIRTGMRPFLDGSPYGRLDKIFPRVWSLNGGGKNGLVAYASLMPRLEECVREA